MVKKTISFLLAMLVLVLSLPSVFAVNETDDTKVTLNYEELLSDSRVRKLIDFDFDDQESEDPE